MAAGRGPLLYVLASFPIVSETFVLREILALEAAGERVLVVSLQRPPDGPRHAAVTRLQAEIEYLPRGVARYWAALRAQPRLVLARPRSWIGNACRALAAGEVKAFLVAGLVAGRVRRSGVRHVHAHFAFAGAD